MATRYQGRDYERGRNYERYGRHYDEGRGFFDRAGDEVRSWFGDEEAGRRRLDERLEGRRYREPGHRPWYDFDDVRAHEVMTRGVVKVHPWDTVERAARLMGECDCGVLPVATEQGRLVGMVTDRDIAVRIAGRGADARRARVDECMTDEAFACHADDSIINCMRTMSRHQVRRVPIVDDRERVIGIVSQSDLARHAGTHPGRGERRAMADVLCAVSKPTHVPYR